MRSLWLIALILSHKAWWSKWQTSSWHRRVVYYLWRPWLLMWIELILILSRWYSKRWCWSLLVRTLVLLIYVVKCSDLAAKVRILTLSLALDLALHIHSMRRSPVLTWLSTFLHAQLRLYHLLWTLTRQHVSVSLHHLHWLDWLLLLAILFFQHFNPFK